MMGLFALIGSKAARWAMIAIAALASGVVLFARIFAAGEAKQKLTDANGAIRDATLRSTIDDKIAQAGDAANRAGLNKWVRHD